MRLSQADTSRSDWEKEIDAYSNKTCRCLENRTIETQPQARAEGIGLSIKGGLLTRFERIVVLIAGLLLNQLTIALWVLAVLTNFTALQRIWLTWQATRGNTRNIKREVPGVNEA
jgi:hypothetical protein